MIVLPPGGRALPLERLDGGPGARAFLDLVGASEARYVFDPGRAGIDLHCDNGAGMGRNRARLKLWVPRKGVLLAFVYKDSQIPFSRDRFAYGAMEIRSRPGGREDPGSEGGLLLSYVESGLHPDLRPGGLKRAFPYTIPV